MQLFSYQFSTMGCPASAKFYAKNKAFADSFFLEITSEAHRLDLKYSNYTAHSFTADINRSAGNKDGIIVDDETAGLLDYATECFDLSDGLFDITAGSLFKAWDFHTQKTPSKADLAKVMKTVGWQKVKWKRPLLFLPLKGMTLDFGGVVKEYAVDRIVGLCRQNGIEHGLIELGGDLALIGPHADGRPWNIGVRMPQAQDNFGIELMSGAVATSGDYERFIQVGDKRLSHIINPKTGHPTESVSTVTVIADHCLVAGSLTTIAFLKGAEGAKWLEDQGTPYLFALNKGNVCCSPEFTLKNLNVKAS